ncbi:MAG: DUF4349 domain-containing protein [Fuerstia sp.]|nr:DUF4349 domain-containing protein [Fuerstiella sp.]
MRVKWVAVYLLIVPAVMGGCSSPEGLGEFAATSAVNSMVAAKSQPTDEVPSAEAKSARHVIREGELRFETDDKTATRTAILGFVNVHQGYLADDREQRNSEVLEQTMTIRVPSAEFDGLLEDVSKGVSRFDKREIQAIDVTEQYVDIEARLKTKKETESRYRELLKQANSVEEILKIEEQIDKLRAEIESTEGRLRLMKDRENYSTLRVSFYETFARSAGFWTRVRSNFSLGWTVVVEATIAIVTLWPLLLLTMLGSLMVYWYNRKTSVRKATV